MNEPVGTPEPVVPKKNNTVLIVVIVLVVVCCCCVAITALGYNFGDDILSLIGVSY